MGMKAWPEGQRLHLSPRALIRFKQPVAPSHGAAELSPLLTFALFFFYCRPRVSY